MSHRRSFGDDYLVVELPLRLTRAELARLRLAAMDALEKPHEFQERCVRRARDHAEATLRLNRSRTAIVGAELFADPAWNIMLDLFVRGVDGETTTVSSACIGADVPSTTALRHLTVLLKHGLIERHACTRDQRVMYVQLTGEGHARMLKLLS